MIKKWRLGLILIWVLVVAFSASARAQQAAYVDLFPKPQAQGELPVTLHIDQRALNRVVVVGFGVPFPPGFLQDTKLLSLRDDLGEEMPISVTQLARWPQSAPHGGGLRSVLIQFRDLYQSDTPRHYTLTWGKARTANETKSWPARTDWVPVTDGTYPEGAVQEPAVFATLPAAWLSQCLLKGRTSPAGRYADFEWYDTFFQRFFITASGQWDSRVKYDQYLDYVNKYDPWQLDRATTMFLAYFRNGAVNMLRHAHRAAQYYASKIDQEGAFILKKDKDLKYAYQECSALDYWLTGDRELLPVMDRVSQALGWWNPDYQSKMGQGFWTERHFTFWLLGATVYYEVTGDQKYLDMARKAVDSAARMLSDPPSGAPRNYGCFIHNAKQHGEGFNDNMCSPWMTALMTDAIMRYYIVSGDPRVPGMLISVADFMATRGIRSYYYASHKPPKPPYTAPFYWVRPSNEDKNGRADSNDYHHSLDVAGVIALGKYFAGKAGLAKPAYDKALADLMWTAGHFFKNNYNEKFPDHGRPKAKVAIRLVNWSFRTTAGMDWYIHQ